MSKLNKKSVSGVIFDNINYIFMFIFCISTIYPFLYLLSVSLSPPDISFTKINIIPPRIVFTNYINVIESDYILSGFINTVRRTVLGTVFTVIITLFAAYPLSKKYYPNRNFWTAIIVITMFFNGGLIPNYLLVRGLGLFNSVWALILPGLISTFTMIIVRNFFMAIPESLEESARIDGANDIKILFTIIIPVSMPIIATITLWTAVNHWNAWFDSLIYITDAKKQVLQIIMRRVVLEGTQQMVELGSPQDEITVNPESIKAAVIMFTTLPMLMFYPFLQKYFVKGIMIGSLKG